MVNERLPARYRGMADAYRVGAGIDGVCAAHRGVVEPSTMTKPARLAKPAMASRWRLSLSLSVPMFVALEVRKYATAWIISPERFFMSCSDLNRAWFESGSSRGLGLLCPVPI